MFRFPLISTALGGALVCAPAAAEPTERCAVMVQAGDTVRTDFVEGYVITGVATPLQLPEGYSGAAALMCLRSTLAILDDDYRVITELGVPLYLGSGDRVIVLERSNGQFRVRVQRGELADFEREGVREALNRAQSIVQSEAHD